MKVVIPGGSGHVGAVLTRALLQEGHDVVVISRGRNPARARTVSWDGETLGPWAREIDGCDVVVNLAGRSVNCRYSARHRTEILESRVRSTRIVGDAIARASRPPRLWLQASTATIYAHRYDAPNDETTGIIGNDPTEPGSWKFSIDVARAWEAALSDAITPATRKVALRSAMTMSPDHGGIFDTLRGLASAGLGGAAGDGRQFVSWVHEVDFMRAIKWIVDRDHISGAINVASPNPLPNREFMGTLREACRIPIGLPASRWMLEVGAVFLRTETELILKSRRVVPGRLIRDGFVFHYPLWADAARELCQRSSPRKEKAA